MRAPYSLIIFVLFSFWTLTGSAQPGLSGIPTGSQRPTLITASQPMIAVPSIASQLANGTFKPAIDKVKEFNPKHWGSNTSVPGKGLPKGNDPLWEQQKSAAMNPGRAPILTFEAASATATPTDPTGAVGPNHFINSWNSAFRIWDKAGNPLTAAASLGTILPGTLGDPIVIYDRYADRFLITEFYNNGFDVAVSQGPDPVNDGWFVYRFPTNTFPDYPKFSVWSDGYYITANKDQSSASTSQVVFALERDKMLVGNTSAQMIGFPLTGIVTSGFYSPLSFNANGPTLPPAGNAPIIYMQDDSWSGVSTDHLKIWSVNVNWTTPASSTISSPQILNTQPFDGLFDGGSFSNIPQPSGSDVDALQATIMFMAQYRRFPTYNSAVINFVVDLNGADNYSGIRWYELRQTTDGAPWTIYQEGTYSQPNGHSAFCGNMCMDANGNIGMAYTICSTTQYPSLRFTGRYASDPLGTMTLGEEVIATGTQSDPSSRYGDYAQMTIDPTDDVTFWSIGEYFNGGRKNHVGVFQIAPPSLTAEFSATPTTVCAGSTVTFTDQSLASPTSWNWSFPGGSPSSYSGQTPPPVTYASAGTYDVTLTVSDGIDTDSQTKTAYITVKNLIADFTGAPTTVVIGNSATFTDNSSCNPTGWSWSFPGGTPSSYSGQTPPAIVYNTVGTYDVILTITKPGSSDTQTRTGFITVTPPIFNMTNGTITTCTGDFYDSGGSASAYTDSENFTETFYPSTPGSMVRFTFSSFSTESGYDYLRIYNGTDATATLIGTYSGTTGPGVVTANNPSGALTFNFTSDGSVTSTGWAAAISCYNLVDPPVADFSASSTTPSINSTVTFTDLSINSPTSWAWTFSPNTVIYTGGTNANSQNPQVQFTAQGAYTVSLTASNTYGSDTETKTGYITVGPEAYLMSNGTVTTCSGSFYDSGGEAGSYANSENFTLTFLPATSGAMVRATFSAFNTESGYDYLYVYNGTDATAALLGTFNGTAIPGVMTANNPAGALTFRFTSDGSATRVGWAAAISCYSLVDPPVAAFTASATSAAVNSTVTFTDQTINTPTSWLWSFSPNNVVFTGGTSAVSQNPQVQFTSLGLYSVTLTATNAYGSDAEIKTDYISVIPVNYCTPTYTTGTGSGDYITLVQLGSINNATGASSSPFYTYYNTLSTDLNPGNEYTITLSPGTYTSGNYVAVWIDFNQNSVFDTDEKLGTIGISPTPATGTITFTVPSGATPGTTRMRVREVWNNSNFDACTSYSYGETEDYNVNILSTGKILNLTVYLEGLYAGSGNMNVANDESGPHFGPGVADQISIELHNQANYATIEHIVPDVNLGTNGSASVTIPSSFNGSYYLTVRHRNSLETTSAGPVSFAGPVIDFAFDAPASAFGGNLLEMIDGQYVIYGGDVNQDGSIDTGDGTPVDNDQFGFVGGYVNTDINGDGIVDTGDGTIVDNNQFNFIGTILP
ncbi:MAG: PKD domain-containing protein [Bacteroidales bacterium]|nr:PKD domain-containing protein [Bacteroidales bacterium]